eukprot:maker-scaffold277_size226016-snap-gene-0.20 protein:Tk10741 transcript:maker-scaffold277_size226016-snap-gene-0.20-mRNA-1 annotation:"rna pseudouridylate synthase domain-containing protein 4-like"
MPTRFGSVRLDSHNPQLEAPERSGPKASVGSSLEFKTPPTTPAEAVESHPQHFWYEEPSRHPDLAQEFTGYVPTGDVPLNPPRTWMPRVERLPEVETLPPAMGESLIEDQYFSGLQAGQSSSGPQPEAAEAQTEVEKLSDIDEQYFGSARAVDLPVRTDPQDTRAVRQLVQESTRDLNYVDEQLFTDQTRASVPRKRPQPARRPPPRQSSALEYVKQLRQDPVLLQRGRPEGMIAQIGVSLKARLNEAAHLKQITHDAVEGPQDVEEPSQSPNPKLGGKLWEQLKPLGLSSLTSLEVIDLLKKSIIFDDHDVLALNKVYGMSMAGSQSGDFHSIQRYLPDLARILDVPELHVVHRLDKSTTGVLLLAKSPLMASTLKDLFRRRLIDKRYWAIVRGEPKPSGGIINIPMAETQLNGRFRMTVNPDYGGSKLIRHKSNPKRELFPAVTEYRTLGSAHGMSLVEAKPITGYRHQIRCHLSFGISCPVAGDHLYTYIGEVGRPQRLPPWALQKLGIRAAEARNLPLYLHAKNIQIPNIVPEKNVWVDASLSHHFNRMMKKLKLKPSSLVAI